MVKATPKHTTLGSAGSAGAAARVLLHEAKLGNTAPLAGYLSSGGPLTPELRKFLAELCLLAEGKRGKAELRSLEKRMIARHVEGLIEDGSQTEAAVAEVMKSRDVSRATVYAALRESKKRK